jgi:hypothetical protein
MAAARPPAACAAHHHAQGTYTANAASSLAQLPDSVQRFIAQAQSFGQPVIAMTLGCVPPPPPAAQPLLLVA